MNRKKNITISTTVFSLIGVLSARSVFAAALNNPLGANVTSPDDIVSNVIKVFLGIVGAIALLIIIYGGFELLISAGNQEKVDKGKKALTWAVIGLVVVFGSYGITTAIFNAIAGKPI